MNGSNIDFSDIDTLRWIQASNAKAVADFGWVMGAAAIPTTGVYGTMLANGSTAASLLSGFLKDDVLSSVESAVLSTGFEKFAASKGVPPDVASHISNALGTAGVWDAIVEKANGFFKGK